MKGLEGGSCKRRVSRFSHQLLSGDYYLDALDAHSSANFIEVKSEFEFIRPIRNVVSMLIGHHFHKVLFFQFFFFIWGFDATQYLLHIVLLKTWIVNMLLYFAMIT